MALEHLNTAKVLILENIVNAAKKKLNTPQDRLTVKAKWDKKGNNWKPISSVKTTKKRKISNTGRLAGSIKYNIVGNKLILSTLGYGEAIDQGREPGEYAPGDDIDKWAKQRGIKGGGFLANRKLKFFGMPATYFLTGPVEDMIPKIGEILTNAYAKDLDELMKNN